MLIDFNNFNINSLHPHTDFQKKVCGFLEEWYSDTQSVPVQTSGSTGAPKIFQIEKKRMKHSAAITCAFLSLKKNDAALLCLPIEYISGKMMVVRASEVGMKLTVSEPSLKPLENLTEKTDFCAMTPLQVENSLDKIHLIKKLIIGGAAVSESLKAKIFAVMEKRQAGSGESAAGNGEQDSDYQQSLTISQTSIYETYGMSETLSHIALNKIYPAAEEYFTAFDGVKISTDNRGCLKIDAPELNPETLQTNDIVELKNGNQFRFLGRADNIINSGGAKIFPEQIEALVKKEISNEVVFMGVPDDSLGQRLIVVIEGKKEKALENCIQNIKFEKSFHRPKAIYFIEKIPRTPNGKVHRGALLDKLITEKLA